MIEADLPVTHWRTNFIERHDKGRVVESRWRDSSKPMIEVVLLADFEHCANQLRVAETFYRSAIRQRNRERERATQAEAAEVRQRALASKDARRVARLEGIIGDILAGTPDAEMMRWQLTAALFENAPCVAVPALADEAL